MNKILNGYIPEPDFLRTARKAEKKYKRSITPNLIDKDLEKSIIEDIKSGAIVLNLDF